MEPAGVTLPRVLGHENAGWVEAVGSAVYDRRPGRGGARLPAVQLRALRPLPARKRHALRAARVHGPDGRRGLRRVRARAGALADQAARRDRAGRRRAALGCRPDRLSRRAAACASRRARDDGGRDRRRRRRAHRAAADPRARLELGDRGRYGRAPSPTRSRARRRRGRRRRGRRRGGAGADRRSWRRPRLRLRRHRPVACRLARRCSPRAAPTRSSATAASSAFPSVALVALRAGGGRQPRRHVDRPLGAAAAPRGGQDRPQDREPPARRRQRGPRRAP